MKIHLYWLVNNGIPYYVGVTTSGKQRYSGKKKKDIVFIEEFDSRIEARNAEEYWISQLKTWGFKIENKQASPHLLRYISQNFVEKRFKVTRQQSKIIDSLELSFGVDRSEIVQTAIIDFLNLIRWKSSKG